MSQTGQPHQIAVSFQYLRRYLGGGRESYNAMDMHLNVHLLEQYGPQILELQNISVSQTTLPKLN